MKVRAALPALFSAVALAGCGGQTGAGATSPAVVATPAPAPAPPIPVVEPFCTAEHPQHASAAELVDGADAVVRGRATASRDHEVRSDPPSGSDPAADPRAGRTQEEIDRVPGIPADDLDVAGTDELSAEVAARAPPG